MIESLPNTPWRRRPVLSRDEWLGRLLLCVHPAVPQVSMLPALLVWGLGVDQQVAASWLGWPSNKISARLRRFVRRCESLRLTPRIPPGRDFVSRYHRVLGLLHRSAEWSRAGPDAAGLIDVLVETVDGLVNHPLAGTPEAHALRAAVVRMVAARAA